jgi:hypothetical protein
MGLRKKRSQQQEQLAREAASRERESKETLNTLVTLNEELLVQARRIEKLVASIERSITDD